MPLGPSWAVWGTVCGPSSASWGPLGGLLGACGGASWSILNGWPFLGLLGLSLGRKAGNVRSGTP
eukprot:1519872-Pyramimonas_sp.AAC.1